MNLKLLPVTVDGKLISGIAIYSGLWRGKMGDKPRAVLMCGYIWMELENPAESLRVFVVNIIRKTKEQLPFTKLMKEIKVHMNIERTLIKLPPVVATTPLIRESSIQL